MSLHLIDIVADGDTLIILPVVNVLDPDSLSDVRAVAAEKSVARYEDNSAADDSTRSAKRLKLSIEGDAGKCQRLEIQLACTVTLNTKAQQSQRLVPPKPFKKYFISKFP